MKDKQCPSCGMLRTVGQFWSHKKQQDPNESCNTCMELEFTPFHFESNQAWGTCYCLDDWKEVVDNYLSYWQTLNLRSAMQANYRQLDSPEPLSHNFGFRREHCGSNSLTDFALRHDMLADLLSVHEDVVDVPHDVMLINKVRR